MVKEKVTDVSRETFERVNNLMFQYKEQLDAYAESLLRWNKKVNVISRNTSKAEVLNHIRHSLYLCEYIPAKCNNVIDAGSGGGLPGIPLGIVRPEISIELVDVVAKKMLLTDAICRELGIKNIKSKHGSIADVLPQKETIIVTKHAFKINDLLSMVQVHTFKGIIMLKGEDYMEELKSIKDEVEIEVKRIDAVEKSDFFAGKCVLSIKAV